jgi:hypothetical protein
MLAPFTKAKVIASTLTATPVARASRTNWFNEAPASTFAYPASSAYVPAPMTQSQGAKYTMAAVLVRGAVSPMFFHG